MSEPRDRARARKGRQGRAEEEGGEGGERGGGEVKVLIIYFELYPHPERQRHAYLTSIVDIYPAFIFDVYI